MNGFRTFAINCLLSIHFRVEKSKVRMTGRCETPPNCQIPGFSWTRAIQRWISYVSRDFQRVSSRLQKVRSTMETRWKPSISLRFPLYTKNPLLEIYQSPPCLFFSLFPSLHFLPLKFESNNVKLPQDLQSCSNQGERWCKSFLSLSRYRSSPSHLHSLCSLPL